MRRLHHFKLEYQLPCGGAGFFVIVQSLKREKAKTCQIYSYCISPPAGLAHVQACIYTQTVYVTTNVY